MKKLSIEAIKQKIKDTSPRIKLISNPGAGVATLPYLTTRLLGKVRPKEAMPGPAVTPYYVTTVTAESMNVNLKRVKTSSSRDSQRRHSCPLNLSSNDPKFKQLNVLTSASVH